MKQRLVCSEVNVGLWLLVFFQDLKEQNLLVQESKQLLEEELSSLSLQQNLLSMMTRVTRFVRGNIIVRYLAEKKGEIAKLKMQVDALQAAKDTDLQQIQELIEANTRLEFEKIHGYDVWRSSFSQ